MRQTRRRYWTRYIEPSGPSRGAALRTGFCSVWLQRRDETPTRLRYLASPAKRSCDTAMMTRALGCQALSEAAAAAAER